MVGILISPTESSGGSGLVQATNPEYYGFMGWTMDPLINSGTDLNGTSGIIFLERFRCITSDVAKHIIYQLGIAGSNETPGANWLGIYDTGQTTPGVSTLLAQTADQSSNFEGATGMISAALATEIELTTNEDYFLAFLENNTGSAAAFLGMNQSPLANYGLSGLQYRLCGLDGSNSTLPATIAEADLDGTVFNGPGVYFGFLITT